MTQTPVKFQYLYHEQRKKERGIESYANKLKIYLFLMHFDMFL